jgi:hypothetical protein
MRLVKNDRNLGAIGNINRLIHLSNGKFFTVWASDDLRSSNYIDECVASFEKDPDAILCLPRIKMIYGESNEVISEIAYDSSRSTKGTPANYVRNLWSLPATALYGMFRLPQIKKMSPIPIQLGGDIAFLQSSLLLGKVIFAGGIDLDFKLRSVWNTKLDDIKFFYGDAEPKNLRFPFIGLYFSKLKYIFASNISFLGKTFCILGLFFHLGRTKFDRVILRTLSFLFPREIGYRLAIKYYFSFMHPKFIKIINDDVFMNRLYE